MTPQNQQALNDGGEVELADGDATARISLLTRFPIAERIRRLFTSSPIPGGWLCRRMAATFI